MSLNLPPPSLSSSDTCGTDPALPERHCALRAHPSQSPRWECQSHRSGYCYAVGPTRFSTPQVLPQAPSPLGLRRLSSPEPLPAAALATLAPPRLPCVAGIFFGPPARSQMKTWRHITNHERPAFTCALPTSSFNLTHFSSSTFAWGSFCVSYFPASSVSAWLGPSISRVSLFLPDPTA